MCAMHAPVSTRHDAVSIFVTRVAFDTTRGFVVSSVFEFRSRLFVY